MRKQLRYFLPVLWNDWTKLITSDHMTRGSFKRHVTSCIRVPFIVGTINVLNANQINFVVFESILIMEHYYHIIITYTYILMFDIIHIYLQYIVILRLD